MGTTIVTIDSAGVLKGIARISLVRRFDDTVRHWLRTGK
jgi:hypothetical protein